MFPPPFSPEGFTMRNAVLGATALLGLGRSTHVSVRHGKCIYIPARGSGGFTGTKPGMHTFAGPAGATYMGTRIAISKTEESKKMLHQRSSMTWSRTWLKQVSFMTNIAKSGRRWRQCCTRTARRIRRRIRGRLLPGEAEVAKGAHCASLAWAYSGGPDQQ